MVNNFLSGLLIDLSEIIDNKEELNIDEVVMHIHEKNIVQLLIRKYGDKYDDTCLKYLVDFRIDELNTIIYDTYDAHNINKLPKYSNGLNLLVGVIAQAMQ